MTTQTELKATTPVIPSVRLAVDELAPRINKAMTTLEAASRHISLEPVLIELVRARASQLNGCAYCVDMHTRDALAAGDTQQRLFALPVWRETPFFTARERAALAFTEDVTLLTSTHVPDEAYAAVAKEYSEQEVAALVSLIVMINAWNAVGVSTRTWEPGSYQP